MPSPTPSTLTSLLLPLLLSTTCSTPATAEASPKRGLVFVPSSDHPEDNALWQPPNAQLTWYYNYQPIPSPAYASLSQDEYEFVPMLWGVPDNPDDTSFYEEVKGLIEGGRNITHVLGFNEPDGPYEYGGSDTAPALAARSWAANMEPLKEEFPWLRLGLPACTAAWGWVEWLDGFLGNCSEIVHDGEKNCTMDFLPMHWYDNFGGLASHMGTAREFFPDTPLWITEYAYANQELAPTQEFYTMSAEYFDRLDFVERYTYFGAFRSHVSNVGPNAVFLNNDGELTDIGSWYIGGEATGVVPQSGTPSSGVIARGRAGGLVMGLTAGVVVVGLGLL